MVKVDCLPKVALATCLSAAVASAANVNFINKCPHSVELYHSQLGSAVAKVADIAVGASTSIYVTGPSHMYRHGQDPSATLVELSVDKHVWMDISIIPPMPAYCDSYIACKAGGKVGFNLPISIVPKTNNGSGSTCHGIECAADSPKTCADAYHFPLDNSKTHSCPMDTELDVTFCYVQLSPSPPPYEQQSPVQQDYEQQSPVQQDYDQQKPDQQKPDQQKPDQQKPDQQSSDQQDPEQQDPIRQDDSYLPLPTVIPVDTDVTQILGNALTLGTVKSKYTYAGKNAGNVPGSYDRVTDLCQCKKERVTINSPVGPLSEAVTMVFRGPLILFDVAVYIMDTTTTKWLRVSSYSKKDQTVENMTFMNNKNVDYSGQDRHSPQGYASADGMSKADNATVFNGVLKEAADVSKIGGGSGISTGVEVNILTGTKCVDGGECVGFHGENDYQGWVGGKKIFVTKVMMPHDTAPNQPAIWMLNAQVVHSNQYGCNCRGMGPVGGCGELDLTEVIETNAKRDMITTHYYFYDGSILSPLGDNFAPRRHDKPTVYLTIIDDSKDGLVKIVEVDDFDFSQVDITSLYQQLVDC
ncbi:hypothetical protein CCR75_007312 [Bremia lactucae]|uniref:glucan endo-1,3-beta-D-glucosidase n=1 Tax=Bremia lactucae TaxID=4779 RepID=A0A976ICW7_BRELC|nr:hypothetical protein CCR75_007312 [Bremia lactucae]